MKEKLITKSFERLLAKGLHRGFITYEELGKSLGKRGKSTENLEKAVIIIFDNKISLVAKKSEYQPLKKKESSQSDSEKSTDKSDDPLENWVKDNHIRYFRGNLNNVLKRFFDTAKQVGADIIVRITADCPLIDPEVVDNVISGFLEGGYDYYSNTNPPTFPDGLDTEVFSFATLERAYKEAELQSEIEHVTPYIRNHPGIFKMGNYKSEINYEYLRWTLDNREDYDLLTRIFNALRKENSFISHKEVMNYIDADSNLLKTNAHIKRNEGYIKSLMDDKRVK